MYNEKSESVDESLPSKKEIEKSFSSEALPSIKKDPFVKLNKEQMNKLSKGDKVRISYIPKGERKKVISNATVHVATGGSFSYKLENGKMVSQLRVNNHSVMIKNPLKENVNEDHAEVGEVIIVDGEEGKVIDITKKDGSEVYKIDFEGDVRDIPGSMLEAVAASPEPNSAVGRRLTPELPKNVDIIFDTTHVGGVVTKCIRALLQYPSGKGELFPPIEQPGATSLEELSTLADTLEFEVAKRIHDAIVQVQDVPSERPEHSGEKVEFGE